MTERPVSRQSVSAIVTSIAMLCASLLLVGLRGGLLAWSGVVLALLLLAKVLLRPSFADTLTAALVLLIWAIAWPLTWMYVKYTWESGEVAEIKFEANSEEQSARLWVMDRHGKATLYYDAPPDFAKTLLAGTPMILNRNGSITQGCANAVEVSSLAEGTRIEILELMNQKYGTLNKATDVFYQILGGDRRRVPILLSIVDC